MTQRKVPYHVSGKQSVRTSRKQAGASKSRTAESATTGAKAARLSASIDQAEPSLTGRSARRGGKRTKTVLGKETALEILQQSLANAQDEGLIIGATNAGAPLGVLLLSIENAYYCSTCGNFSLGACCAKDLTHV